MSICEKIIQEAEDLFECTPFDEYIRIETPFLYPDGDIIDLFYRGNDPSLRILTDLGGASDWLSLQNIAKNRTDKQKKWIDYICNTRSVEC